MERIQAKIYENNPDLFTYPQMKNHLDLYKKYVRNVNDYFDDSDNPNINYDANAVMLHELFFENIKSYANTSDKSNLLFKNMMGFNFYMFEDWKRDFIKTAIKSRGWVIFGFDPILGIYRNVSMESHDKGFTIGLESALVLDCYEHSYFMNYGSDKAGYIGAFINNINWDIVMDRMNSITLATS